MDIDIPLDAFCFQNHRNLDFLYRLHTCSSHHRNPPGPLDHDLSCADPPGLRTLVDVWSPSSAEEPSLSSAHATACRHMNPWLAFYQGLAVVVPGRFGDNDGTILVKHCWQPRPCLKLGIVKQEQSEYLPRQDYFQSPTHLDVASTLA